MMKNSFFIWTVVLTILCVSHPSVWAKDTDSIPLVYHPFLTHDEPESAAIPGKTVKAQKKTIRKAGAEETTAEVRTLEKLIINEFHGPQEGYIQLSNTEFIVFVGNTGRVGLGLYLADLSTNTVSDQPFGHGYVEIKSTLKDKSGNDYLLLSHSCPPHNGIGSEYYSLLSARKSRLGKAMVDLLELGYYDVFEYDTAEACREDGYRKKTLNESVTVTVEDRNRDGWPDLVVTLRQIHCANLKRKITTTVYIADTHGFRPKFSEDPHVLADRLLKAQKRSIQTYHKTKNQGDAATILQNAGIGLVLDNKPEAMSDATYASLLNDYAFFLGPYGNALQAINLLDRVVAMSPHRAVAYLNRAELLYQMMIVGDLKTQEEKVAAAREIMSNYMEYKKLSGKTLKQWENFCSFNLAVYPKGINVCDYVKKYCEASRIGILPREKELFLETRRLDINNDGLVEGVTFAPAKYGYKEYGGVTFTDSNGKDVTFNGTVSRKKDTGYGFKIFSFEGKIYKLLPLKDVSIIDHDKENLVCE